MRDGDYVCLRCPNRAERHANSFQTTGELHVSSGKASTVEHANVIVSGMAREVNDFPKVICRFAGRGEREAMNLGLGPNQFNPLRFCR
jgi:hypothetical protein